MLATQARVAVLGVLGLLALAVGIATADQGAPATLGPAQHIERGVADPTAGLPELVAWRQAEHNQAVGDYLRAEHARQLQVAADAQRVADARRAAQRAARSASAPRGGRTADAATWAALRQCENGGSYRSAQGDQYRGAYQFSRATWASLGYTGDPAEAPPEVQDAAAAKNLAVSGWGQWPRCARRLGLR